MQLLIEEIQKLKAMVTKQGVPMKHGVPSPLAPSITRERGEAFVPE